MQAIFRPHSFLPQNIVSVASLEMKCILLYANDAR